MTPEHKSPGNEMNEKSGLTKMQRRNNATFRERGNNCEVHVSEYKIGPWTSNKA